MGFSSSWLLSALLLPVFISTSLSLCSAPTNNVTLFGDASFRNGSISLSQEFACVYSSPPSSSCGAGRALCAHPIRFLDPVTNTAASFWSRFSFSVIPSSASVFGDGLTFLITSIAGAPCNSAGHLGLLNCVTNAKESFVAVEFDTYLDPSLGDLNDNHVALDINSVVSFVSVDLGTMGIDLKSGRRMTAWIEYRHREKMMRVWLGYSPFRPSVPILAVGVDLSKHLKEFMHVGFSASNGRGSALHLIDKWQFRTFRFLTVTPADTGRGEDEEEEGCFTCSGEGLSIKKESTDPHKRRRRTIIEVGLALGGTAAFLFSMGVVVGGTSWYLLRKRRIDARGSKTRQMCRIQMKKIPKRLSLAEIKTATKGFKQSRIVGEGASGTVYQGTLASGRLPVDEDGTVLVDWVWDMWAIGKLKEACDGSLMAMEKLDNTVEMRMLLVGLSCVHPNSLERPVVREAARMLRGEAPLPVLPSRKPVVRLRSILPEGSEEILQHGDDSTGTPWSTPRTHFKINAVHVAPEICEKCGVKGFSEHLIYCSQCKVYAEHIYCLDKLPEQGVLEVIWSCEQCAPRTSSSFNRLGLHPSRRTENMKRKKIISFSNAEIHVQNCDTTTALQSDKLSSDGENYIQLSSDGENYIQLSSDGNSEEAKKSKKQIHVQNCDTALQSDKVGLKGDTQMNKDLPDPAEVTTDSLPHEKNYIHHSSDGSEEAKSKKNRRKLILYDEQSSSGDTESAKNRNSSVVPAVRNAPFGHSRYPSPGSSYDSVEYLVEGETSKDLFTEVNLEERRKKRWGRYKNQDITTGRISDTRWNINEKLWLYQNLIFYIRYSILRSSVRRLQENTKEQRDLTWRVQTIEDQQTVIFDALREAGLIRPTKPVARPQVPFSSSASNIPKISTSFRSPLSVPPATSPSSPLAPEAGD
ncbi:hypothetical protein NE237_030742 [Protea cynaroides]|uniref:Legume lectin domain-containing protein n=1 Tax=Protea cynaroides TaxID=273540 RepID=A0A9Q0GUT3_9MAGN|nr:hypothetical protein NE237_030742 [Protea cynaroides]